MIRLKHVNFTVLQTHQRINLSLKLFRRTKSPDDPHYAKHENL